MDVREELIRLYTSYNPKRLKDVDALLERFKGREHVIVASLRERYTKSGAADAGGARSAKAPSITNSSLLFMNASSAAEDVHEVSTASSAGVAIVGRAPSTHRVPALKPVAPAAPLTRSFSFTSRMPHDTPSPPQHRRHAADTSDTDVSRLTASATQPPPPPPRPASSAASPFLLPAVAATPNELTSPARLDEMRTLIRQMTSLDAGKLAMRVEELTRSSAHEDDDDGARIPRLQWRRRDNTHIDTPASFARKTPDNVSAVLLHTSVYVKFFAECAHRYVELAQAEQRYWEAQQRQKHEQREATDSNAAAATAGNAATPNNADTHDTSVRRKDVPLISSSLPTHTAALHSPMTSSSRSSNGNNDNVDEAVPQQRAYEATLRRPTNSSPHSGRVESTTATAAKDRHGASPSSPSPPFLSPSPPSTQHGGRSTPSAVRSIRRVRSASPLSTDDAGSSSNHPPARRSTTVSPLTSPDGPRSSPEWRRRQEDDGDDDDVFSPTDTPHRRRSLSHTPPPAASSKEGAPLRHADIFREELSAPPPPPGSPPPQFYGPLTTMPAVAHSPAKRVLHWAPSASQGNRYGLSCATLTSGDCVVLQPGVYYENLRLEHCGTVELTSAFPGAAVVLRPFSDLEPVLTVSGAAAQVKLTGIVLVQGDMMSSSEEEEEVQQTRPPHHHYPSNTGVDHGRQQQSGERHGRPAVPLLSVTDGATVTATASHFYGGTGGGVVAAGRHTRLQLDLCLISLCRFAGVYLHGGATADVTQSKIKKSEVGLRVLQGSFFVSETAFEDNRSDGVVVYEGSIGVLERSNIFSNGGNGVFLASGTELRVVASTIELNALYGVQRSRGSTLHVKTSFVRDNGLLPINEELE
ncbi:hypothetical protein ABB37_09606 [Leptomonas pyrrhocoris]|uniref:Right handed beta helix domain-containing protein n=1 Tax=Leptomonas pyrrhocoris TaxID=157538 RepID=A0A0M9FQ65_LEPPY|nr:hypothetical protein ABB37_09606 [Leptomonas pyrrhocoris]KPA73669.1 hypothetical protein ABB37_09606 [Leptomonas pyrrhocoris]|eukprot:XP_015652108.1 hypothetical protein ABB37_09606 [Leptomonas pyrrhocoris]